MSYTDHEPMMAWWEEFICGVLGGATGLFQFPGIPLILCGVKAGWIGITCLAAGICCGCWLAYEAIKEKRTNRK